MQEFKMQEFYDSQNSYLRCCDQKTKFDLITTINCSFLKLLNFNAKQAEFSSLLPSYFKEALSCLTEMFQNLLFGHFC